MDEPYYYVALVMLKQTGYDDEPTMVREIVKLHDTTPPTKDELIATSDWEDWGKVIEAISMLDV